MIDLKTKILSLFKKKTGIGFTDYGAWETYFGQLITSNNDLYRSFTYACVNLRASKLASANIIIQENKNGKWGEIENESDYVYTFMNRYNAYDQTMYDLLKLASISLDMTGKQYWLIVRDSFRPIEFIPLPSSTKYILDSTKTFIIAYEYQSNGRLVRVPAEDVLYIYQPIYDSPYECKATVSALSDQTSIEMLQSDFQKNFLKNNARFDGFLSTETKLTKEQRDALKAQWQLKQGGSANAGKTPVLDGGLTYNQMQSTQREMDYVNSRNAIRDEIMTVFGVPKTVLGITEDVNRANATATMRSFLQNTIIPFSKIFENKLTVFLRKEFKRDLRILFDYQLEEDPQTVVDQLDLLMKYKSLNKNELRAAYDYDEILIPEFTEYVQEPEPVNNDNQNQDNE